MNKKIYLLLAFFLLVPGIGSFAQTITRGPYLQSGTPNSMTIKWRTNVATSTRVWYGPSPSTLPFTVTVNGTRTDHEVKVPGLAANTTYFYAVGNSAGQLVQPSASHYFRTSPTPGATQTIRAWVLGDCGTGDAKQRAVRDAFYNFNGAQHIDLMLLLGDNAYEDGTDLEFQAAFFENMYEDKLINTVMWPAIGNHETVTADSPTQSGPYYDIFTMPTNGEAGGVPSGTEAYYSFDYGNIHFVVLDSDDSGRNPGDPQLVWLENDLSSTNQDWIVAYWHHPPYSKDGESDNNSKERKTRESFLPVLESHGVDLVLVGHSHNWQRSYLIHGHYGLSTTWNPATMGIDLGDGRLNGTGAYTKNAQGQGTVYIVSGSAGKKTGPIAGPHPVMYRSQADYGSMYLEVTGGQMDIKFLRENGNIDDYLTIVKQVASGLPPSVSIAAPADGAHYLAPQSINITANASDSDGSVTQVEFFVNNMSIGVDNQAPWSVNYWLPAEGNYNLTAVARDNQNNTAQSAMVHVSVGPATTCARIATGSDDAEERPTGSVSVTNSDLELCNDPGVGDQIIGLRFTGLNIPPGAAITEARIRFTADENVNDNPCNLTIYGQASDNAAAFTTATRNVSSRPRTNASALWQPANWLAVGDAGTAQQTVNIAAIVQEIVNRPGYTANSAIALIIQGVGRRTAESYEGSAPKAAELCITYSLAQPDCPALGANIGAPCDDGDNTTVNDVVNANCNCAGTPTACTGIGDADGDGICANVDCDDNNPNITSYTGAACDDGNPATVGDVLDANCNCAGTLNTCPGVGDNDGDGICADVDCDDNNPNSSPVAGSPCDDGDNTTVNDIYGPNCNCAGTPTACTGIGDADGDGICADVDCNDNNPNITSYPGAACNDGNPATNGETIQADCSCGGGTDLPTSTCSTINAGSDDAEQRVGSGSTNLTSNDLELITDGVAQLVGLRFNGLNIPQGAFIVNAHIQFTVDEAVNDNPCDLSITGQASDNAPTFAGLNSNISSRPRTASSVSWSPPQWTAVGQAGPAQRTPNLAAIIQEIVNRPGYTSASSIALIIEGTGRRTAESFEAPAGAPRLCVDYFSTPPAYDCPALSAYFGSPCDDGDNTTINDTVDGDCNCAGTPTACTGFGDADGDGVCANVDCNDNDPNVTHRPGDACDDGNPATINDVYTPGCACAGTLNTCPGTGDADGDGICADVDCNDNNPSITTRPGDPCDDGNANTVGETIQADCSCGGGNSTPQLACSRVSSSSDDAEQQAGSADLTSSDLELATDGLSQTIGLRFNGLNIPQGAVITSAHIQFTVDETANDNPCVINIYGQAADNAGTFLSAIGNITSRPRTGASVSWSPPTWSPVGAAGDAQKTPNLAPVIQEIVNRSGYTAASSIVVIMDGTGRRTAESFNGSPSQAPQLCVSYLYAPNANQQEGTSAVAGRSLDTGRDAAADIPIGPIRIFPNPATDQLTVAFSSTVDGQARIQARSLNGQAVLQEVQEIHKGANIITLKGLSLPDGLYILQLFTGDTLQFEKFVIQHE